MSAGEAGGVGDHGQHVRSQVLVGGPGEIGGIDSAGIGHQRAPEPVQMFVEGGLFAGEFGGSRHGDMVIRAGLDHEGYELWGDAGQVKVPRLRLAAPHLLGMTVFYAGRVLGGGSERSWEVRHSFNAA